MATIETVDDLVVEASNRLSRRLGSETQPDAGLLESLVDDALLELSRRIPRKVSASVDADGATYDFSLSGWALNYSQIERIEYPTGEHPPRYLSVRNTPWETDPASGALRFLTLAPSSGTGIIKVWYTRPWTSDDTAVAALSDATLGVPATLYLCAHYADHFAVMSSHESSPEIAAEPVTMGERPTGWRAIAVEFRKRADDLTATTTAGGLLRARAVLPRGSDIG